MEDASKRREDSGKPRPPEILFSNLCKVFNLLEELRSGQRYYPPNQKAEMKKQAVTAFLESSRRDTGEMFEIARLVLPHIDTERGNYSLKAKALGKAFTHAVGLGKDSPQARVIENFKNPSTRDAGNFPAVLRDQIFNHYARKSYSDGGPPPLTVADVNTILDDLVKAAAASGAATDDENRSMSRLDAQTAVLRPLMARATAVELYWICRLIFKDMKLGLSESTIFKAWHPDAQSRYDTTMNLRAIFTEMTDPNRPFRVDISPGQPSRPQYAIAAHSTREVWLRMHRTENIPQSQHPGTKRPIAAKVPPDCFLCETKLDGERMQVHRCGGSDIKYFSRRAIEHGESSNYTYLNDVIIKATGGDEHQQCILDGEIVVWNRQRQAFEPFGTIRPTINAIVEGRKGSERVNAEHYSGVMTQGGDVDLERPRVQDLELLYVAFDVLYVDGSSVTARPLQDRHKILRDVVAPTGPMPIGTSPICARVVPLLPNETYFGRVLASRVGHSEADIEAALKSAAEQREEGIVVKSFDAPWRSNDRSNSWVKIKPDYLDNIELDCVILGGFYGEGRRAGQGVTQWLLGLAQPSPPGSDCPMTFKTFCRIGTGFSDEENINLNERLKPLFQETSGGKSPPASCVIATGREKPDIWITDPFKSVVITVQSDVRLIVSREFATRFSVRFPRTTGIREDKPPTLATTETDLEDQLQYVQEKGKEAAEQGGTKAVSGRSARRSHRGPKGRFSKRRRIGVASVFKLADVSDVHVETEVLKGCKVWFANIDSRDANRPSLSSKEEASKLVKRLGGSVFANPVPTVTHILAARVEGDGRLQHIIQRDDRDVYTVGWLLRCVEQGRRVPFKPRDYIHRSAATRHATESCDRFGDPYFSDVSFDDVAALLTHHMACGVFDPVVVVDQLADALERSALPGDGASEHESRGAIQAAGDMAADLRMESAGAPGTRQDSALRALLLFLDKNLAAEGYLEKRGALLHGCTIVLLDLSKQSANGSAPLHQRKRNPTDEGGDEKRHAAGLSESNKGAVSHHRPLSREASRDGDGGFTLASAIHARQAAATVAASAQTLHIKRLSIIARLHGAQVVDTISHSGVTHVVGVVLDSERETNADVDPHDVLSAVKHGAGGAGAVDVLHAQLGSGTVQFVSSDWIDAVAGIAMAPVAGSKRNAEEKEKAAEAVHIDGAVDAGQYPLMDSETLEKWRIWPWELYAVGGSKSKATVRFGTDEEHQHDHQQQQQQKEAAHAGRPISSPKIRARRKGTAGAAAGGGEARSLPRPPSPRAGEVVHVPRRRRGRATRIASPPGFKSTSTTQQEEHDFESGQDAFVDLVSSPESMSTEQSQQPPPRRRGRATTQQSPSSLQRYKAYDVATSSSPPFEARAVDTDMADVAPGPGPIDGTFTEDQEGQTKTNYHTKNNRSTSNEGLETATSIDMAPPGAHVNPLERPYLSLLETMLGRPLSTVSTGAQGGSRTNALVDTSSQFPHTASVPVSVAGGVAKQAVEESGGLPVEPPGMMPTAEIGEDAPTGKKVEKEGLEAMQSMKGAPSIPQEGMAFPGPRAVQMADKDGAARASSGGARSKMSLKERAKRMGLVKE